MNIGEGEGKLSGESFPSPSPNPTPFPSKTFVNGAGGGSGGLAARVLLEVPRSRPPVPGISPDCAGWLRRLSGRPSASEFQPRSGIILICVDRSPVSGILASCASVSLFHSGAAPVPGILPGVVWGGSMMYCCWPCIRHSAALSGIGSSLRPPSSGLPYFGGMCCFLGCCGGIEPL